MEPIDLTFQSPLVATPGLDDVIRKLGQVDALLGVFSRRSVTIDLKLNGAGNLEATMSSVQRLVELMRAAGDVKGAGLAAGGQQTMGELAARAKDMVAAKQAELQGVENAITEHHRRIQQLQNKFQFGSEAYNKAELQSRHAIQQGGSQKTEISTQIALMQQALGIAEALRGVDIGAGMAQGVHTTVEAEKKLEHQAENTTAAMSAQMEVAKQKAKMMQDLATAVNATAEADKKQSAAARENAQANSGGHGGGGGGGVTPANLSGAQGAAIRTRTRYEMTPEGLVPVGEVNTFRAGPGHERAVDHEGNVTESRTSMAAQRERLAARLSEYRQQLRGTSDIQRSVLAQQLADDMRRHHAELPEGLQGTTFASGLLGKAGQYEAKAADWRSRSAMPSADDKTFWKQMHLSNERDAAAQQQEQERQAREQAERDARAGELRRVRNQNRGMRGEFESFAERGHMGKPQDETHEDGSRTRKHTAKVSNGVFGGDELMHLTERWDAHGNRLASTLRSTNNELTRASRGVTGLGESMARNLVSVTQWSAAVGVLYGGLGALKSGFVGAIHTDREMAFMGSIFRGAPGEYKALTSDLLGVATDQGRMSGEALAAGAKFAHLGLTRGQTTQFTALAMKAANIMGPSTDGEEAGHAVASITEAFHMDIGQATVALDELNSIANHSNTTVKELMETMGRTGAVAKATGFEFSQYASLLAGGAGKTGLPVTQMAQSFGMLLTNAADPLRQKELKARFGVDVFREDGVAKSGPDLVADMQKRYQQMSPEAGQSMLTLMGGARNAQRTGAMFDGYDESISRSITAQRDLNSATNENNRILDTTQAKLASLESAWVAVWHAANQGGLKGATNAVLGGAAGLLGAADRGFGYLGAGISDLVGTPFRKLGWALGGMQGDSPKMDGLDRFLESEEAKNFTKDREKSIMADRMEWEHAKSARKVDFSVAQHFGSAAEKIGQLPADEGEKLLGLLAGDLGGDDATVGKNKRDWLKLYDHGKGSGGIAEMLAKKAAETKAKAVGGQGAENDALGRLRANYESSMAMMESYGLVDPAVKRMINAGWKTELGNIGAEHKGLPDAEVELRQPASRATTNMRERVRYTLMGQDWFAGNMRHGSDPMEQLDAERSGIALRGGERDRLVEQIPIRTFGKHSDGQMREWAALRDQADTIGFEMQKRQSIVDARLPFVPGIEAGLDMHRAMGAYGAGINPTRQIADALRGAKEQQERIGTLPGNEQAGAREALVNELYDRRNQLLTRQYSILHDIHQTQEQMSREAARNILMGSAGDQLAAAGMQLAMDRRGGKALSMEEFGVLDPSTKQAMLRTNPDLAPPMMNPLGELNREKGDLDRGGAAMRQELQDLIDRNRQGIPQVVVLPDVVQHFTFGEDMKTFMVSITEMTSRGLQNEFAAMRAQWAGMMAAQMVAQAAGAGAEAVLNTQ